MFIKKIFKDSKKAKCWCQQNFRVLSRDPYIFWVFFRLGIIVPSFITVGYVRQILGRGGLFGHPIREQLRKDPSWIELKISSSKLKNIKILFQWNFPYGINIKDSWLKGHGKRFSKLWTVQSWSLFLKIRHHFLRKRIESCTLQWSLSLKFLTFNAFLLFKSCQWVLDLNGRIGKPLEKF